jgi:hypothetical protein
LANLPSPALRSNVHSLYLCKSILKCNRAATDCLAADARDEEQNVGLKDAFDAETMPLMGAVICAELALKFLDEKTGIVSWCLNEFEFKLRGVLIEKIPLLAA